MPASSRPFLPRLLAASALALSGFVTYRGSLDAPFLWDDRIAIVENRVIRHPWPFGRGEPDVQTPESGRPVVRLTLAWNHALGELELESAGPLARLARGLGVGRGGLDPRGYRVLNLAVHVLAALLLSGVARATLARLPSLAGAASSLAFAVAALWLVHPLHTETVAYVIQRTELLMGLFLLATLYAAIRALDGARAGLWSAASIAACALGMGCKEVMAAAPLVVALHDRAFSFASWREALARRRALYAGLAATWIPLALLVASGPRDESVGLGLGVPWWRYGLTQLGLVLRYLRLAFWPEGLCFDYGMRLATAAAEIVPGALVLGALALATAWAWVRRPPLGFLGLSFFLLLAPSSSVVPIVTEVGAERRMYLPLAAVVAAVVAGAYVLSARVLGALAARRGRSPASAAPAIAVACLAAPAFVALAWTSARRLEVYESELSIWSDAVAKRPDNPRAHNNLGREYLLAGRAEEALAAFAAAVQLPGCEREAFNNLGHALFELDRVPESAAYFTDLLRDDPTNCGAHEGLGIARLEQERWAEALASLQRCLELGCGSASVHNNLGRAYFNVGRAEDALREFETALRLDPAHEVALENKGKVVRWLATGSTEPQGEE